MLQTIGSYQSAQRVCEVTHITLILSVLVYDLADDDEVYYNMICTMADTSVYFFDTLDENFLIALR